METVKCLRCGHDYQRECLMPNDGTPKYYFTEQMARLRPQHCDACDAAVSAEYEAQKQREKEEHEAQRRNAAVRKLFLHRPLYAESDPKRFPKEWEQIKAWRPNPEGIGLLVSGDTGMRKSRMMFALLREIILKTGASCEAVNCDFLTKQVRAQFRFEDPKVQSEAEDALDRYRTCKVLYLDDLGKEATTDTVESYLYSLIEHRTSRMLCTLASTQMVKAEMLQRLGNDRGPALVRRLCEFSTSIVIPPAPEAAPIR